MKLESASPQHASSLRQAVASVLAYAAIIAIPINIIGVLIGSSRYGNYSQVRNTLSELNRLGSPADAFMHPFELIYFGLLLLFAVQVYYGSSARSMRKIALLIATAVVCGLLLDFVFRLHYPLAEHRGRNGIHTLLALGSAAAMEVALYISSRYFKEVGHPDFARFSRWCLITALVCTVLTLISLGNTLHSYSGLFERLTFGAGLVWLIGFNVITARLGWLRLPGMSEPAEQ
jgi:hypothetical membrane protein